MALHAVGTWVSAEVCLEDSRVVNAAAALGRYPELPKNAFCLLQSRTPCSVPSTRDARKTSNLGRGDSFPKSSWLQGASLQLTCRDWWCRGAGQSRFGCYWPEILAAKDHLPLAGLRAVTSKLTCPQHTPLSFPTGATAALMDQMYSV